EGFRTRVSNRCWDVGLKSVLRDRAEVEVEVGVGTRNQGREPLLGVGSWVDVRSRVSGLKLRSGARIEVRIWISGVELSLGSVLGAEVRCRVLGS
ncbi:hypothetical protein HAX54_050888, partial [Datura stramonium]|nr:hypothetical protein [Datura stramonium]